MKPLEVRIPHRLSPEEIRRRIDVAIVRAQNQYADAVGTINTAWETEDRLRVGLVVMGMNFDGSIDILVEELLVTLTLPGMAALFAGRIRAGIEEQLGGLVGSQRV